MGTGRNAAVRKRQYPLHYFARKFGLSKADAAAILAKAGSQRSVAVALAEELSSPARGETQDPDSKRLPEVRPGQPSG